MNDLIGPDWLTMETARRLHEERLAEAERDRLAARATKGQRPWWANWWGRWPWSRPLAPVTAEPLPAADRAGASVIDGDHRDQEDTPGLVGVGDIDRA